MRTTLKLSLLTLFVVLLLTNCKKGEDDPFISLRSRKARIAGDWKMISGSIGFNEDTYNEYYTLNGRTYAANSTTAIWEGKYTLSLDMDKDGNFTINELFDASNLKLTGKWNFNSGVGDVKSKESVIFTTDTLTKGKVSAGNAFNRFNSTFEYHIKELRNKTLVLHAEGKVLSNSTTSYITVSNNYVFELRD